MLFLLLLALSFVSADNYFYNCDFTKQINMGKVYLEVIYKSFNHELAQTGYNHMNVIGDIIYYTPNLCQNISQLFPYQF